MNQRSSAIAVAVLAAGKGTRMRSQLPKVLHQLGALTLVERTLDTAQHLSPDRCFAIVGYARDRVCETLANRAIAFVEQTEQLGTGHAVQQLLPHLEGFQGDLLVLNADVPLLRASTLQTLVRAHRNQQAAVTLLTAQVADPSGYGRVFCGADSGVKEIVEDRDCTPAQLSHQRINGGIYCFHWPELARVLPQLSANNSQQEYYLTDAVAMLPSAYAIDVPDAQELQGINDRLQLAQADTALQQRIKEDWMRAGVTFVDPNSTTVADTVRLEPDCIIEPQTHLRGTTIVRTGCRIGPNCVIESSSLGAHSRVIYSVVSDSQIGDGVTIGPFAHLRNHVVVGDRCRIGNFVEVKQTAIGPESNVAHLSYLGDASLGCQVNIGAGTITANFDGKEKHRTNIGDRSKTGSNSVLVAPIDIGADVTIAAGSTLTESVPDDCLAIARSRQTVKQDWRPRPKEA